MEFDTTYRVRGLVVASVELMATPDGRVAKVTFGPWPYCLTLPERDARALVVGARLDLGLREVTTLSEPSAAGVGTDPTNISRPVS